MNINLIVAADKNTGGIGKDGKMPWHIKEDLKWFKKITVGNGNNAVIMGRKTYESIGKPLPNRLNIVLTRDKNYKAESGVEVIDDIYTAIEIATDTNVEELFFIGGAQVYKKVIEMDIVNTIYIDWINSGLTFHDFDTFFNINIFKEKCRATNDFKFVKSTIFKYNSTDKTEPTVYYRKRTNNDCDAQYLELMNDVMENGEEKSSRAGNVRSVFGRMMDFDVSKEVACLTTKKMYWKGCVTELLWFLRGGTNIKYLIENGCNIWTNDAYRFYVEKFRNSKHELLTKEQFINNIRIGSSIYYVEDDKSKIYTYGDLGPVYGKQWTKWVNTYGKEVNQIDNVIKKLKENPNDRRLIVSAWNVGELDNMALPPCHYMFQFYSSKAAEEERENYAEKHKIDVVDAPERTLSLVWSQRSVDVCLGLPYDMLSYSILLYIIAREVNMIPSRLKCFLGDCHIYENQLDGAQTQLLRNPWLYEHPNLIINDGINSIYGYEIGDIIISKSYLANHYNAIKFPLSVGLKQ